MKKWSLWLGIAAFVIGLLVIIFPTFWVRLIFGTFGLFAIGYGIYCLKDKKDIFDNEKYKRSNLIQSIASICIGLITVIFPLAIGQTVWTFVIILMVIFLIGYSVLGFYTGYLLKQAGLDASSEIIKRNRIESISSLLFAVLVCLISPQKLGSAIIRIVGIVIILAGIALIIYSIISKNDIIVTSVNMETENTSEEDKE